MRACDVFSGDGPVILGVPHAGTHVPDAVLTSLNHQGLLLADTDWHMDRLYADLLPRATMVRANFHRYVVDANRDPSGVSLYPGQNTTGLCPTTDFDGRPIYEAGEEPDAVEIEERRLAWHAPYHMALEAEIKRVKAIHGVAILYDCHSIRSEIPFLFEGRLPDFNIGDNQGASCAAIVRAALEDVASSASAYSSVVNGRFKGGWTTRHYGRPADGVHAIQMELSQRTHLESEEPPFRYSEQKAAKLRIELSQILNKLEEIAPSLAEAQHGAENKHV